jgi:tRNA A-37 threonylcarbamoyl transferase component Bud32
MQPIDFLSHSVYLHLPTKQNCKVILDVANHRVASNSFKLYNPFSKKARLLKWAAQKCFVTLNPLFKGLATKQQVDSAFITYLESELGEDFTVSVYNATAGDKLVLQLQTKAGVYGYVKFPLNAIGLERIANERKAIELLSEKGIVQPLIATLSFNNTPFIIINELDGTIEDVSIKDTFDVLHQFKKTKQYALKNHPRTLQLIAQTENSGIIFLNKTLYELMAKSQANYYEVFEHGDFTPWNLVKTKQGLVPFDFEYFVERGLEHLDAIKFIYQLGKLLNGFQGNELQDFVITQIECDESQLLFKIFLIKEILRLENDGENFDFELQMLQL